MTFYSNTHRKYRFEGLVWLLILLFIKDNAPDTTSWIGTVTLTPRYQMEMTVEYSLSRISSCIYTDIESCHLGILLKYQLPLLLQQSVDRIPLRLVQIKHVSYMSLWYH